MAVVGRGKTRRKKAVAAQDLRLLNLVVAALGVLQGVLILLLSNSGRGSMPITTSYLAKDRAASAVAGETVSRQADHLLFDLNLAYLVAGFLFFSGLVHLLIATRYRSSYQAGLKSRLSKPRWLNLSISFSLVVVAVALLSGVFDLSSLLMIAALSALLGLTGLAIESGVFSAKNLKLVPYVEGLKLALLPWLVIVIYLWGAHAYGNAVPTFVYFIYGTLAGALVLGLANFYLQLKKAGHWEDYLFAERAFILLTVLVQAAVAWQIFFGTLR